MACHGTPHSVPLVPPQRPHAPSGFTARYSVLFGQLPKAQFSSSSTAFFVSADHSAAAQAAHHREPRHLAVQATSQAIHIAQRALCKSSVSKSFQDLTAILWKLHEAPALKKPYLTQTDALARAEAGHFYRKTFLAVFLPYNSCFMPAP